MILRHDKTMIEAIHTSNATTIVVGERNIREFLPPIVEVVEK